VCCLLLQGSDRTLQYAAFFADCQHELSSISSGMRLVLVYNLVWAGPAGEAPRLCKSNPEEQLARALDAWEAELAAGGTQQRMSVLLGALTASAAPCCAVCVGPLLKRA
jgi:hypothetical protein